MTTTTAATGIRDTRTFWRLLLAFVAPIAGFALAAANALSPGDLGGSSEDLVASVAAHQGAAEAGIWLSGLFLLTLVPGAIAVAWVSRRRNPTFTAIAGFLVILGFISGTANPATDLVALIGVQKGVDTKVLVTLVDALNNSAFTGVALLPFLLAITLGRLLLGILLWRARVAPRWMAAALIAAAPVEFLNVTGGNLQPTLSWALTGLGFASATVALLRMSNDEFDLPPAPPASSEKE
ncbi:MAG: hypothetical protein JWN00_1568 [Actinomycetia bacterium]|nr:hypothetical protein [Actinomycetes bacterium]